MLGHRIKELRENKGISQISLAKELSVTPATISYYEKGSRIPTLDKLLKLSKIFNTSLDYLCGTEYFLNDEKEKYLVDEFVFKAIKRSTITYNFIQENPRINLLILEQYIRKIQDIQKTNK